MTSEDAIPRPIVAPLFGRHVYLRPPNPGDYAFLQGVEVAGDSATYWRFRGATPSPEQWAHSLWAGVLVQHLIVSRRDDRPIGLVFVYRADFQDGHAYLAATRFDLTDQSPLMIFGIALFLRYVFSCWNLRKLYMETPAYSYTQFESGVGRFFEVEGRLRDHSFLAGRYWDQLILGLERDTCLERLRPLLDAEAVELDKPAPTISIRLPQPPARSVDRA